MRIFENLDEYKQRIILEGGHTFPNVGRINKEDIGPTLSAFYKPILSKLGLTEKNIAPLGSVGKKDTSGDIDILIHGDIVAKHLRIKGGIEELSERIPQEIYNVMDNAWGKKYMTNYTKGLKVSNIAFPIYNKDGITDAFVQIDLMTSFGENALELGSFIYHSPDVTKGESKYSGAHRTMFLMSLFKWTEMSPEEKAEEFFGDEYDGKHTGKLKSYSKYSLLPQGMMKQRKSYEGKRAPVKNPKTIKDMNKLISTKPEVITKYVLGQLGSVEDTNSFESLFRFIESGKNKILYDNRAVIYKDFAENRGKNVELPNEIKKYI